MTTLNNTDRDDEKNITYDFTSSGHTLGFETFRLNSDETYELYITPKDPKSEVWLSITEVS